MDMFLKKIFRSLCVVVAPVGCVPQHVKYNILCHHVPSLYHISTHLNMLMEMQHSRPFIISGDFSTQRYSGIINMGRE